MRELNESTREPSRDLAGLLDLMRRLRDPEGGCPWDRAQDFTSIAPFTIEEAYEVADAIAHGRPEAIRDELGDLLFQVVFHARMAEERSWFSFDDVVAAIVNKMVRRHPHVFGDHVFANAGEQSAAWEAMKRAEHASARDPSEVEDTSALAGISVGMPEMARALKLTQRAAKQGFDWPDPAPVLEKLHEEIDEFRDALAAGEASEREDEFGDMLFVLMNLARHYRIDPQAALRAANRKFERRFRAMELLALARGTPLSTLPLADQDQLWDTVKIQEKAVRNA